jgi:hypothetical protein
MNTVPAILSAIVVTYFTTKFLTKINDLKIRDPTSPQSSAPVKNAWSCTSIPPVSSWRGTWLSRGTPLPLPFTVALIHLHLTLC